MATTRGKWATSELPAVFNTLFQAKQFSWLWGNSKAEATEIKSKPNSVRANLRQNPQVLQRRTNQFVNEIQVEKKFSVLKGG